MGGTSHLAAGMMLSPDIVYRARAPLRLSFGGGGSELPPYVHEYGGVALNITIGRYVYASIHCNAKHNQVEFIASDCGLAETLPLQAEYALHGEEVRLPLHRAVYNHIIKNHCNGQPVPLVLNSYSDAPVGSGLGTSSTLTVAILRCFDGAFNLNLDEYALAQMAYHIERRDLQLSGGYQDHYAAAFGGVNFMEFRTDGKVVVNALRVNQAVLAELEYCLILYFTGVSRASASIIDAQTHRITSDKAVTACVHQIKQLAYVMKDQLLLGEIKAFALTLRDSWLLKRGTAAQISNQNIDAIFEQAFRSGAWGGKISGAGGGGFMMLIADPHRRHEIIAQLPGANLHGCACHFSQRGAISWRTARSADE